MRCSSLPLVCACPAAGVATDMVIRADDEPARLGSAVHEAQALRLAGTDPDYLALSKSWRCDPEELEILSRWLWAQWQQIASWFPDPRTEVELRGEWLTGHVDVLSLPNCVWDADTLEILDGEWPTVAHLCDYKSGRVYADAGDQVRGYAYLVCERFPSVEKVYTSVLRVRDQSSEGAWYTREQLAEWGRATQARLSERSTFNPGAACLYCPRVVSCEANTAWLRKGAEVLSLVGDIATLPDIDVLANMLTASRQLVKLCEHVQDAIKARVSIAGGLIPIPGAGQALKLTVQEQRKIDFAAGLPVLRRYVPPDELAECCTIGKTKADAAVRKAFPPREKKAGLESVMAELREADALRLHLVRKLEVVKHAETTPGLQLPADQVADVFGSAEHEIVGGEG